MNLKEERGPFWGKKQYLGFIEDLPHEGWGVQSVNVLFTLQKPEFQLGRSGIFTHKSQEWQKEHTVSQK